MAQIPGQTGTKQEKNSSFFQRVLGGNMPGRSDKAPGDTAMACVVNSVSCEPENTIRKKHMPTAESQLDQLCLLTNTSH